MIKVTTEEAKRLVSEDVFFPEWEDPETLKEIDPEELEELVEELDPLVRPIIKDLVEAGFVTTYSCQGGPGHEWKNCIITLDGTVEEVTEEHRKEIDRILRRHTNMPYTLITGVFGQATIAFEGPLKEEKMENVERKINEEEKEVREMKSLNARIKELHSEGHSVSEIKKILSQELGRKIRYQRIYNVLLPLGPITDGAPERRKGISEKIKEMLEAGSSVREVCAALLVYPNQVYQVKKKLQIK